MRPRSSIFSATELPPHNSAMHSGPIPQRNCIKPLFQLFLVSGVLLFGVLGCTPDSKLKHQAEQETHITPIATEKETSLATDSLWQLNSQTIKLLNQSVKDLKVTIDSFLKNPTDKNLSTARIQWIESAMLLRRYQFSSQLGAALPVRLNEIRESYYRIGASPILPGYIDSFGAYQYSGLVNDMSIPLTAENLTEQHGLTDSGEAVLGLYAMEFLLFGEQQNRTAKDFSQASQLTSKQVEQGYKNTDELAVNRRRKLLAMQGQLLVQDCSTLSTIWQRDSATYKNWDSLSSADKNMAIKQGIDRQVALLLTEIVELSKPGSSSFEGQIAAAVHNLNQRQKQQWLLIAMESIAPAMAFLPKETQEIQGIKLASLTSKLKETELDENKENYEEIYQLTKGLLDEL